MRRLLRTYIVALHAVAMVMVLSFAPANAGCIIGGGFICSNTPSGGWTPASLSNLAAWWKSDNAPTNSGGPSFNISSWTDSSGNGFTVTPIGASLPTYNPSNTLNGITVVTYPTGAGGLKTGSFALGGATLSVFAVIQCATYTSSPRVFGLNVSGSDNGAAGGVLIWNPDATELKTQNSGATQADTGTGILTGATWYQLGAIWDGTNSLIYVNNVQKASHANAPSFAATLTSFDIGANPTGGNNLQGFLAEVVVVKGVISSTDRTNLYNYFLAKWGVG